MVFKHNYTEVIEQDFICCLDGCDDMFKIKIFPKQFVYPRFCLAHRNDYKRRHFQMQYKRLKQLEAMKKKKAG